MKNKEKMRMIVILFILLYSTVLISCADYGFKSDRVHLSSVSSITLHRGQYTKGRRSAPIPQLECVGGTARGKFVPKTVQCYNRGFDGSDYQWECKAEMGSEYEFGKISVSCEGYDSEFDEYILAGSCGLRYELDYTVSGAKRATFGKNHEGFDATTLIYIGLAAFVVYLIYTTLTAPREGSEGDRRGGSGFDHGPGHPPGGGPPPPGWRQQPPPSYDESCKYTSGSRSSGTSGGSNSGPGFFTGLGLGALGGYLFGGRGSDGYGAYQRRPRRMYNQFERDTGFYDEPSTSGSYYRDSTPPSSGTTHTSTGFGGTTRR